MLAANLIELALSQSRHAVSGISEIADRTEGRAIQGTQIADISAELQNKSNEELLYYLDHGRYAITQDSGD